VNYLEINYLPKKPSILLHFW